MDHVKEDTGAPLDSLAWPLIDKPGEVTAMVLCRPCVDDDDDETDERYRHEGKVVPDGWSSK